MQLSDLAELYSSKSDEEILQLAENLDALEDNAKAALATELSRRELVVRDSAPPTSSWPIYVRKAKWVGLWLLNTLIATIGSAINVGVFTYSTKAFVSHSLRIRFVLSPYYPFSILIGLCVGFFSYLRFRGSYRYWVWVIPSLMTLKAVTRWQAENQTRFSAALIHYFGPIPYPQNRDQLDTTLFLYLALAFALGASLHTLMENRQVSPPWLPVPRNRQTKLSE